MVREVFIPDRIKEKLREESEKRCMSEDELILEVVVKYLDEEIDPETKADIHEELSEKYMREAEEFLKKKDYVQASEKAWGAASQIVKALAAKKGKEIRSHGELHRFVSELARGRGDDDIRRLWQSAGMLHQNFYENWLPEDMVVENIKDVKEFVRRLKS